MTISLTPELDKQLEAVMAQGHYESPEEALHRAIDLLDRQTRHDRLRTIIGEADVAIARGEVDDLTPELLQRIDAEADEMFRNGVKPSQPSCLPLSRGSGYLDKRNGI